MSEDRRFARGERVVVDDTVYYVKPHGTAVYLYHDDTLAGEYRTMRRAVLARKVGAVKEVQHVRRHATRFLYVMRDCDLDAAVRELKIGITNNVATTLRTYRRRKPNDQCIMVVDCDTYSGAARALERQLLETYADMRVDQSEVVRVRPHEIRRELGRRKFTQSSNGIFVQK